MAPVTSKRSALGPASTTLRRRGVGGPEPSPANVASTVWALKMAELGQGALVDEPAAAEDPDAVADGLDLAEDVRGQEDRLAALAGLADAGAEDQLHQGVEAARRLVEEQQVRAGGERGDSWTFWRLPFDSARIRLRGSSWKRSTSSSR